MRGNIKKKCSIHIVLLFFFLYTFPQSTKCSPKENQNDMFFLLPNVSLFQAHFMI